MKVGITYDLRDEYLKMGMSEEDTAEFDRVDTIEAIDNALTRLGHLTDRIGTVHNLIKRLAKGDRWDLVFNIAEGVSGFGREAQVPAVLDAFDIPYTFSGPMVLALTLHKGMTKHIVRDLNIPTPDFVVVNKPSELKKIALPLPLFVKPVAEGSSKGIYPQSKVTKKRDLMPACIRLMERFEQPVLVETYLPGREFTVGIVGTGRAARSIGVIEVLARTEGNDVYSYENKENYQELVEYRLATGKISAEAESVALEAWRGLGCRDAGRVDVKADETGIVNFLEINPLAGLNPVRSDLCIIARKVGISYEALIGEIMSSAIERMTLKAKLAKGA
ncbi:MAG: D-alanine--D-alanine ligase [Deltaproteobacteria bacterium]|uniref:D-alanine--D-alanine ligase n=1 Tax=Candidatus Zymogenus saltonus TaxID=2844893 RepID=A0A9D8KEC7_9DELT|nr:D-alanine--D-alanine ligase [Candidatus Zymogenus saltonus]